MAKNKKIVESESEAVVDVKSLIHEHSQFFDNLVELIPAKFYLPDETERPYFHGLSKKEKASAKRETKENIKKARRDRLDPEKSSMTTLDLLKENLEKEKTKANESDEDDDEMDLNKPIMSGVEGDDRSVTYDELRERLHRKIEELKAGRGGSSKPRDDKNKKQFLQNKRKRDSESEKNKSLAGKSSAKIGEDVEEAAKGLAFSHVKIGDDDDLGKKKKRKLSRSKELENAMKLKEAKKDPEKGKTIATKHSWQAATSRAAGVKVHDDPKLLKQSMRKEKKQHEKNSAKWKERIETQQKMQSEKQDKRSKNIADRVHQKKMKKIEKREKKLLRPGFEGRREGFINKGAEK